MLINKHQCVYKGHAKTNRNLLATLYLSNEIKLELLELFADYLNFFFFFFHSHCNIIVPVLKNLRRVEVL